MTVGELIELLSNFDADMNVDVFAEGDEYPILVVEQFDGAVSIGCGWVAK